MTVLRRPSPAARLLDLTRLLAEDYDSVPLPIVTRAVQEAASLVRPSKKADGSSVALVERLAREELSRHHTARR